jgi:hypothetical protein
MEVGSLERLFRTPIAWAVGRRPSAVCPREHEPGGTARDRLMRDFSTQHIV